MTRNKHEDDNDPAALLKAAERYEGRTRERLAPGSIEFSALLMALIAAALLTGAAYTGHWFSRAGAAALVISGGVNILRSLRSRLGLGASLSVWTWALPTALFVAEVVSDLALDGTARDVSMMALFAAATIMLGVVLHARWLIGVGVCLVIIVIVGFTLLADLSSAGSAAVGVAFGVGTAYGGSSRARKKRDTERAAGA